jgi:hypothetical protein
MKRFFSHRLALLTVAILAVTVPVAADEPVPFACRAGETITDVTPVGPGLLEVTATVVGQATYLGQFTGTETVVLNLADGTFAGTRVFVAANGDRLYADVKGAFTSATTAVGTFTFTGGTGRFSDALGEADFEVVTLDGIHLALTSAGTIEF